MALIRLLLFALFAFLVVTVAAFVYLEWWQAILVSFATFVMLAYTGKFMVRAAVSRLGQFAGELFQVKSRVLRGTTMQVHSVRPIDPPADLAVPDEGDPDPEIPSEPTTTTKDLDWYEIELTLFPAAGAPGPMTHWDIDDLRLVPADTPDLSGMLDLDGDVEVGLDRLRIIENGEAIDPEQPKFHGPRRLRFIAGFPRMISGWKFRYYFEQFGRIDLPASRTLR